MADGDEAWWRTTQPRWKAPPVRRALADPRAHDHPSNSVVAGAGRGSGQGAALLLDRSADPEEPLRVYADPAGHPFCIFVAPDPAPA